MIAFNPNSLCVEAEPHYYDLIFGKGGQPVPEHVVCHIEKCPNCQEQLSRLRDALSRADSLDSKQRQADSAITTMLRLHFGYIGRPVTCEIVKPFLPTLLDPVLQVRVPTPITAHLGNCHQCSEDLKTIQEMTLNRRQLGRLSQLFAESQVEDAVSCSDAQAGGLAAVLLVFRKTNAGVLKHLCTCPDCRKALYQFRESIRKDLSHEEQIEKEFPCEKVSAADIFDYGVPYGIDPVADEYGKFREPLAEHIRSCPVCLAKIQQLHNTVYGIAERADSDVVTIYHIDESAKVQTPTESDDLYAGFPIRVEIGDCEGQVKSEEAGSTVSFAAAVKRRVSTINVKPLAKIAVVAAAVLIVAALFFNTPSAKAITLAEIYRALENVQNVYIAHFVSGRKEPVQQQWVSRSLGFHLIKTERQFVLRDVPSGQMTVRQLGDDSVEIRSMSPEMISDANKRLRGSLGLVLFAELSRLPKNSTWSPIGDDQLAAAPEGVEVYDLTWTQEVPNGPVMMRKWRFFVDSQTGLPRKVELYRKSTNDREYERKFVKTVEYLTDKQIQEAVDGVSSSQ